VGIERGCPTGIRGARASLWPWPEDQPAESLDTVRLGGPSGGAEQVRKVEVVGSQLRVMRAEFCYAPIERVPVQDPGEPEPTTMMMELRQQSEVGCRES
jgi:hypothetical protein